MEKKKERMIDKKRIERGQNKEKNRKENWDRNKRERIHKECEWFQIGLFNKVPIVKRYLQD